MKVLSFCQCGKIKGQCGCNKEREHSKNTTQRGYGYDWQLLSKRFRRENPLCVRCLGMGIIKPTKHAHHVVPIIDDPSRRLDESNLMAVCEECHLILEKGHLAGRHLTHD